MEQKCEQAADCPFVDDTYVELIAEKAIEKLTSQVYQQVGKSVVSKLLYISDCNFDIGTMSYFINKESSFSQVADFYCCNNKLNIAAANFSFSTTGVTKYVMANNVFTNTAKNLQTVP